MGSSLGAANNTRAAEGKRVAKRITGSEPDKYRAVWWPPEMLRDWPNDNHDVAVLNAQYTVLRKRYAAALERKRIADAEADTKAYRTKLSAEEDYRLPLSIAESVPSMTNAMYDAFMRLSDFGGWPPDADPYYRPKQKRLNLPDLPRRPPPTRNTTRDTLEVMDVLFLKYQMSRSERWGQYTDAMRVFVRKKQDPFAGCKNNCCERKDLTCDCECCDGCC